MLQPDASLIFRQLCHARTLAPHCHYQTSEIEGKFDNFRVSKFILALVYQYSVLGRSYLDNHDIFCKSNTQCLAVMYSNFVLVTNLHRRHASLHLMVPLFVSQREEQHYRNAFIRSTRSLWLPLLDWERALSHPWSVSSCLHHTL